MSMYSKGSPHVHAMKAGETVYVCQCDKTNNAPFCSGAHKGSGKEPYAHTADKDGDVYFCGCGKSANIPFCDGSHNR